jgi:predicted TIM-barrel fold metal-dependent hydrolase
MRFFDCNCSFGSHPRPTFRFAKNASELVEEMDFCGIDNALVYHCGMRFGSPLDWNEELCREISDQPRLLPSWAILPRRTGEFPDPDTLWGRMSALHVRALRAFPQEHHYSLDALTFGELLSFMTEKSLPLFLKENPLSVEKVLKDFPGLRVILMNQGPHSFERYLRPLLDRYESLFLETSYYIIEGSIEEFCNLYGAERILFGTSFPDNCSGGSLLQLLHADISDASKEKIASLNLHRLLDEVRV